MFRNTAALFLVILLILSANISAQSRMAIDSVDGLTPGGKLSAGADLVFYIDLTNESSFPILGATHGFKVYSPDGAEWTPITGDSANIGWGESFDGGLYWSIFSGTGNGIDTIGFGGFTIVGTGLLPGFDGNVFRIMTAVSSNFNGKTLCIDKTYYPPAGHWLWTHSTDGTTVPDWGGPYCFEVSGCCQVMGDINGDGGGPDIADLVYLVAYMFSAGPAPTCLEPNGGQTDVNGSGSGPDIADLVYIVAYMFEGGPAPVSCP